MEKTFKVAIGINIILICVVLLVICYNYFISNIVAIVPSPLEKEESRIEWISMYEEKNRTFKYSSENQYSSSKIKESPDDEYDFLNDQPRDTVPIVQYRVINSSVSNNTLDSIQTSRAMSAKLEGLILVSLSLIVLIGVIWNYKQRDESVVIEAERETNVRLLS